MHFLERLALVATAFVFVRKGAIAAIATSSIVAALYAARGLVRAAAWSSVAATLHLKVVDALLEQDLLRASSLEDDEPEAAVIEGIDAAARIAVDLRPSLVADAAASACVAIFFFATQSLRALLIGSVAVAVTSAVVAVSRSRTISESSREWIAYRPVLDRLVASLHARLEIVGNGSRDAFRLVFSRDLFAWRDTVIRSERILGAVGRAPLLLGGAVVVGLFVLARAAQDGVTLAVVSDAAVFGSALPPFAGLARGLHEIRKAAARTASIDAWLQVSPPARKVDRITSSAPEIIEWRGVSVRYPSASTDALSKIDLTCKSGELVTVAGPNGSGKSTLLKSLLRVGALAEGEILADGRPRVGQDGWRRHLAYLPQRPFVGERLTARDALLLVGDDIDEGAARVWLERVGLWGVLAQKSPNDPLATRVGALSIGERQRLALARFFSRNRTIYLLDEPDANLDAGGVTMVASILRELAEKKIVIVAAHTPELVAAGDTVALLEAGCVKEIRSQKIST